ncbi:AraC family transcriptional regulator [Sorangium sp. So ce1128]
MSRSGQRVTGQAASAIVVGSFELASGERYDWHDHPAHQLAWAARGVLAVSAAGRTWVLPPTRALWIPAGIPHAVEASRPATMQSLYFGVSRCPIAWRAPTAVGVGSLLRELIGYLARPDLAAHARARAEAVVCDLLEPLSVTTIEVPMPVDVRAKRVADALTANPADRRTLAALGRAVGASARTLARVFLAETGMSFGQWRAHLRVRAALAYLAERAPVAVVASRVGYDTSSAFVAAFRRLIGVSPGAYFSDQ